MFIFYDFETSQKDFLGQILAYYFVLVDTNYNELDTCEGLIKPNRLELPAAGAINVNQLSIQDCLSNGLTEFEAANKIYAFLQNTTNAYGNVPLVGFNSARFDFKHLEKLLLKYGLSPTFYGKISSLDIYQFSKYCAQLNSDTFPFVKQKRQDIDCYSFRLEDLAQAFNCLDTPQTHDAKDDVNLTIALTKTLTETYQLSLEEFQKKQHNTSIFNQNDQFIKEPYFQFEQPTDTPIIRYNEWLVIGKVSKSTFILLDVNAYNTKDYSEFSDYSTITKYVNTRSAALIGSTHTQTNIHSQILLDPHIQKIKENALQYFKLFPVNWDIEYRPWAMGFDQIQQLRNYIEQLQQNPNCYSSIIEDWKSNKKNTETRSNELNLMITLFNRFYLNFHPSPNPDHIQKYISPRYKTGTMFRNPMDFVTPETEKTTIEFYLTNTTKATEKQKFTELLDYTKTFISNYIER